MLSPDLAEVPSTGPNPAGPTAGAQAPSPRSGRAGASVVMGKRIYIDEAGWPGRGGQMGSFLREQLFYEKASFGGDDLLGAVFLNDIESLFRIFQLEMLDQEGDVVAVM